MKYILLAAVASGSLIASTTAFARQHEQDAAYAAARSGNIRSLPDIERGVMLRMGGAHYLGPEFDPGTETYRLKFMRSGSVIWVDVDARTGAIIGRSGD